MQIQKTSATASLLPILIKSFKSLMYPQVFMLFFVPLIFSFIVMAIAVWLSLDFWLGFLSKGFIFVQPYLESTLGTFPEFLKDLFSLFAGFAPWIVLLILIAFSVPLIFALNLMIVSLLASTFLVKFIASKDYPHLEFKGHQGWGRGWFNGVFHSVFIGFIFIALWVCLLPFWFVPGLGVLLTSFLSAWFNQRLCSFDALADVASHEERIELQKSLSLKGFILGLMTTYLSYIPLAFLFAPVFTMLAFIHLCFESLQMKRQQNLV